MLRKRPDLPQVKTKIGTFLKEQKPLDFCGEGVSLAIYYGKTLFLFCLLSSAFCLLRLL